jgi:hypothetical protein
MDSYQAVYDAVRSRIHSCDVGEIVRNAAQGLDASHAVLMVQQDFCIAAHEMQRPSVLYRPSIGMDGSKWCALYGDDLMHGISGFGDTPAEAMADFDKNWREQKTPTAQRLAVTRGAKP